MGAVENLFATRKSLDEICTVPDKIISVYALEKHIWADANSLESRKNRLPEEQTVKEFQIGPVRSFLNDILRNMAAPYKPEKKDYPIGQGYWIQAEFGSGKSHLLSFLAALALGNEKVWQLVKAKEADSGQGKRESIYRFWDEGIKAKSSGANKGVFVVARTLVGSGGGAVGLSDKGKRLSEYILESIKEQLLIETGKNLSLYPAEILADRFLKEDIDRYRKDLKKFLKDPNYFAEDAFEDAEEFIKSIQQNKSPGYKRNAGDKLWRFYDEYLKVQPQVPAETEDILKHVVETILAEGYSGVLLILDEISLFMKDRKEDQRVDDEKTLVVLANRLAKVYNLPIWMVCAAQQAIEAKPGLGVKNIIADDRLKLVPLLQNSKDYYDIVLSRVRKIEHPEYVTNYYLHYSSQFTWPKSIGEDEFGHFFPFHKPALEVLRDITHELTTARSAIHFMHQTLKHQVKNKGKELIRLWELFDETMEYEEDPSGTYAGLVAIKTKRESEYRSYLTCRNQIDGLTKGILKVHRERAIRTIQTLFLYHIAHNKMQGLNAEELANAVMIERQPDATPEENIQHYESMAVALNSELPQIVESFDEAKISHYRFEPVVVGIDPNREFQKARDEAEGNEALQGWARERLLALHEWPVNNKHMTINLAGDHKSLFYDIAPFAGPDGSPPTSFSNTTVDVNWQGRQVFGTIAMRDFAKMLASGPHFPIVSSDQDDHDFAIYVASKPVSPKILSDMLMGIKDKRILIWTPDELNHDERQRLLDFAAYVKLIEDWGGKDTEDAVAVVNWVANRLKTEMGKIVQIIQVSYGRGRFDALNNTQMPFHAAGERTAIITPLIDRVLSSVYESRDIKFDHPFIFKKDDAVKVINGIVKSGHIPRNTKSDKNTSAVQNFGAGLKIVKTSKERNLDVNDNPYVNDMWDFIDKHETMNIDTLYKNFMGVGGPKDYGLSRRLVQLYLLCLARNGKVQIHINGKSGLSFSTLDYSNMESVDFSTKVLESMDKIQKVAKPENWEVLRPYAEKLLNKPIAVTHDDSEISQYRALLKEHFSNQKDTSSRVFSQAQNLFAFLQITNPYETEMEQVSKLYTADLSTGNDIDNILYSLKQAFGYSAFDNGRADEKEIMDLAVRLTNYHNVANLLQYVQELRTAFVYCHEELPDYLQLSELRKTQSNVASKLKNLQIYIDSDIKLKTTLIGSAAPGSLEKDTISVLLNDYSAFYVSMHDQVTEQCNNSRHIIKGLLSGTDWSALLLLERITALQPAITPGLERHLLNLADGIFSCPNPSKQSVVGDLGLSPHHSCGLSFANFSAYIAHARNAETEALEFYNKSINDKLQIFLNPAIRERLEQGKKEKIIAQILGCSNTSDIRDLLISKVQKDPKIVDIINRYLKKIMVKKVKLSDFNPANKTVEKEQIDQLGGQLRDFLMSQLNELIAELKEAGEDEDTLPMLVLE
jgi:hypothetical protein